MKAAAFTFFQWDYMSWEREKISRKKMLLYAITAIVAPLILLFVLFISLFRRIMIKQKAS